MTSQTENSTDCTRDEWIPYNPPQPYVQAIGQAEDYSLISAAIRSAQSPIFERETVSEMRRLRSYIESVERIHDREINILYRLIEERTLILSDVDEIYNDYC